MGERYPDMYCGLKTGFDDTIILCDGGVLVKKILLEYKSAKASGGKHIDGNAHERLSYQIMQYLEVATRFTKCSFAVVGNGAFIRYKNKYHATFNVQLDRLSCFSWFCMRYMCCSGEYISFARELVEWLSGGTER